MLSANKYDLTNFFRVAVPGGGSNFTYCPVTEVDANPGDPMWLIESASGGGSGNSLRMVQVSNLTSGPTFGTTRTVSVPTYSTMSRPRQPGGTMPWTFDTRLLGAGEIYGQIVTSQNEATGGNDAGRVYQIDVTTGTPRLAQTITLAQGSGVDTYFPAATMNYYGDIGITFDESSSSENFSMYVTGQSYNDGFWSGGTYQTPVRTFAGTSTYSISRAGDYAGIMTDPNDGISFWAFNEYKGSSTWNTGVSQFYLDNFAPPGGGGSAPSSGSNQQGAGATLAQTSSEASDLALLLSTIGRHQTISDEVLQDF
jgi:hypothetical protein